MDSATIASLANGLGGLGKLFGGGSSTSISTNINNSQALSNQSSNENSFSPTQAVDLFGGVTAPSNTPTFSAPLTSSAPNTQSASAVQPFSATSPATSSLIPLTGSLPGTINPTTGLLTPATSTLSGSLTSTDLLLLTGAGALLLLSMGGKKKR